MFFFVCACVRACVRVSVCEVTVIFNSTNRPRLLVGSALACRAKGCRFDLRQRARSNVEVVNIAYTRRPQRGASSLGYRASRIGRTLKNPQGAKLSSVLPCGAAHGQSCLRTL